MSGPERDSSTRGAAGGVDFDFVVGDDFRDGLRADYAEMTAAAAAGLWKAAHVLAGSIVEAVLIDSIAGATLSDKSKGIDPLKLDLGGALKVCRDENILSARVVNLCDVVRDYRNLIHPGRAARLGKSVDEESAKIAVSLVGMVAKAVGNSRAETLGLTGEQLVGKLRTDASSTSILGHLVRELDNGQAERLLTKVIPTAYLEAPEDYSTDAFRTRLAVAYRTVFDTTTPAAKEKAAAKYLAVIREDADFVVEAWETEFLQPSMLVHLSADDAAVVKAHYIGTLGDRRSVKVMRAGLGLARYFTKAEIGRATDELIKEIAYGKETAEDEAARELLDDFFDGASSANETALIGRLKTWSTFLEKNDREAAAKWIAELRDRYQALHDLPF